MKVDIYRFRKGKDVEIFKGADTLNKENTAAFWELDDILFYKYHTSYLYIERWFEICLGNSGGKVRRTLDPREVPEEYKAWITILV